MIFVTVGTVFGFDRLVRAVDEAVAAGLVDQPVFGQIANGRWEPRHFAWVRTLPKPEFDRQVARASAIIGHAGMGVLTAALAHRKPALVMARLKRHREVVNDHQVAIAEEFARRGHVLYARDAAEIPGRIRQLVTFAPTPRHSDAEAVAQRVANYLASLATALVPGARRCAQRIGETRS